jgi:dTDP-D-glucose 4,6-dehydratase
VPSGRLWGLRRTVEWYLANQEWVEGLITGE